MSSKRQKLASKRSWASEEPTHSYDHDKFVNERAVEKFGLILKNRSFIKEKGFHHSDDFFRKSIAKKDGEHIVNLRAQLPQVWYESSTPISLPTY